MQLPIDVKAVIDEAMDIEGARTTPLSVGMYVDATAPADLVAHVRGAFTPAGAHVRVTVEVFGGAGGNAADASFAPFPGDDVAVVVAGLSEDVGRVAGALRAAGVPAMVATTLPRLVEEIAQAAGCPIPQGDVVAPEEARARLCGSPLGEKAAALAARSGAGVLAGALGRGCAGAAGRDAAAPEPLALDGQAAVLFDRRMGEWVVATCPDKRLAFALAFPFVRRPLAVDAVNATAAQNAGVGLVAFIPGADLPVMTLNQAKMLLQIAAAYGQPLGVQRVKELAAVVGGAFACRAAARQLVAFVPALGWAVKAGIGYAGTVAMGRAAIEYFEGGGSVAGLAGAVAGAREKAASGAARLAGMARAGARR